MERPKYLAASALLLISAIVSRGESKNTTDNCLPWPIEGTVSQGFSSIHEGIDVDPWPATQVPVKSSTNGRVILKQEANISLGKELEIETSDLNQLIIYGHMSGIFVRGGDKVRKGEIIGLTGSTGYSTGEHLHFEVRDFIRDYEVSYGRIDGYVQVDPLNYLCKKTE